MKKKKRLKIFEHWELLIISLVLGFLSWLLVTNIDDYSIAKTIRGIPVEEQNTESITDRGYVYDVTEGDTVNIVVRGPRSVVEPLKAADFKATADLSALSVIDTAEIKISTVNASVEDSITITPENDIMKLSIENKAEKTLPVKVYTTGEVADGFALGTSTTTPNIVTLTGPSSVLENITEVRAVVNVEDQNQTFTTDVTLSCTDAYGVAVNKGNVSLSDVSVSVTVPVNPIRSVPVKVSTTGVPAAGYGVVGIEYNPETVEIAGEEDALKNVSAIEIPNIDVSNAEANVDTNIPLSGYLPEGVYLAESDAQIAVSVKVEKKIVRDIPLEASDVRVIDKAKNLSYNLSLEEGTVVSVTGFVDNVKNLVPDDINPRVSAEGLGVGDHQVVITFTRSDKFEYTGQVKAELSISENTTEDTENTEENTAGEQKGSN